MSKWSRHTAKELPENLHLPALCQTNQDQYTSDNRGKVKILAERFFPKVGQADLQDTSNQIYPPPLNISYMISVKEMKDAIQKLLIGKALGPDKIPNKAIKAALKELTTSFANAATICFQKKTSQMP